MKDYFQIHHGDCFDVLKTLLDNSVDAVVTDPPYGIRFMGEAWDGADIEKKVEKRRSQVSKDTTCAANGGHNSIASEAGKYDFSLKGLKAFEEWTRLWAVEVLRVLKPGGHLVSFAAPRSYHRMCSGIEDAGFEIRDQIQWVFGSGFPKSHNLSGKFKGWGTALKPAYEPICLARKPLISTVANNVATHGTGAINIDDSRILSGTNTLGRWPANLIHDGSNEVRIVFPESNGQQGNLKKQNKTRQSPNGIFSGMRPALDHPKRIDTDKSASRFFYCAKASRNDRGENNKHPTVKPTDLMRYLCRLVTPHGGVVLDPFTGSGSTGKAAIIEGFKFIGIERESKSILTATERCELAARELHKVSLARPRYLLGELV